MPKYTRSDIKQWEEDLQLFPVRIQEVTAKIANHQQNAKQIDSQLQSIQLQIASIEATIEAIHARIEIIESLKTSSELEAQLSSHKSTMDQLNKKLADVTSTLYPLQEKINHLKIMISFKETQATIIELQREIEPHQIKLKTLNVEYGTANAALQYSTQEVQQLRSELHKLEIQNDTDNGLLSDLKLRQSLVPQLFVVAASQPMPHVSYDKEIDEMNHRIERRGNQIMQFKKLIENKDIDRLVNESTVCKLKFNITEHQTIFDTLHKKLSDEVVRLKSFEDKDITSKKSEDITKLRVKLQEQQKAVKPYLLHKNQLNDEISQHTSKIALLTSSLSMLKSKINALANTAKKFEWINDKAKLKTRLDEEYLKKKNLSDERERLKKEFEYKNKELNSEKSSIAAWKDRLAKRNADNTLVMLRDNSENEFNALAQLMHQFLSEYDYKHPAKQSYKLRVYLKEYENDISRIKNYPLLNEPNQHSSLLEKPHCIKYLALCGYFWRMLSEINGDDSDLVTFISQTLNNNMDPQLCLDCYARFHCVQIPESQLNEYEQNKYDKIRLEFKKTLDTLPLRDKKFKNLHDIGLQILKDVDAKKSSIIDIKHATLILENSNNLANDPSNPLLHRNQNHLAEYIPKNHHAEKMRKWGILLIFSGAALATCCAIASIVNPFCTVGVGVGAVTFLTGVGLFSAGNRHLEHTMYNYEQQARVIKPPLVSV